MRRQCFSILALVLSVLLGVYLHPQYLRNTLVNLGLSGADERVFPASFLSSTHSGYQRVVQREKNGTADTTAVILNWSRFHNVVRIVSLLCDSSLENIIHTVVVWNNNPEPIVYKDLPACSGDRLRVFNSPQNLYFQARFIACSESRTPYCFIQDDDYLILPEVITSLRSRIPDPSCSGAIHLLPSHEMLSSQLRTIKVGSHIHTAFAWLGHGTMISRLLAVDFLALMETLDMNEDERNMADNYFSVLRNVPSEVWFDQGIELLGGEPFTIGTEGTERNRKHIIRATQMLGSLFECSPGGCIPKEAVPFVELTARSTASTRPLRTVCRGTPCILEADIANLPKVIIDIETSTPESMLDQEDKIVLELPASVLENYLDYSLSNAVDGLPSTFFQSLYNGRQGDTLIFDTVGPPSGSWTTVELVMLVDHATVDLLHNSSFRATLWSGQDVAILSPMTCISIRTSLHIDWKRLQECSIPLNMEDGHLDAAVKAVTVRLNHSNAHAQWKVHEIWVRGLHLDY